MLGWTEYSSPMPNTCRVAAVKNTSKGGTRPRAVSQPVRPEPKAIVRVRGKIWVLASRLESLFRV